MIFEHELVMQRETAVWIEVVHKNDIKTEHRWRQDGSSRYAITYTVEGPNTDYGFKPKEELDMHSVQKL